jgi:hypothetical protein
MQLMAETYPANYPRPDTNGYSGASTYGLIRTDLVTANPSQIKGFNAAVHTIGMTFSMTQTLFNDWVCWMDDFGQGWFYMDTVTPRTPVTITSTNLFRMVGGTQQVKRGHDYISVTASYDMIPGAPPDPLAPVHAWVDFIVAGSPASPSVDDIIAGSPAAPSTDIVQAQLYGYQ